MTGTPPHTETWTEATGNNSSRTCRTKGRPEAYLIHLTHLHIPHPGAGQLIPSHLANEHVPHPGRAQSITSHPGLHTWSGPIMVSIPFNGTRTLEREPAQPVVPWSQLALYVLTPVPATPESKAIYRPATACMHITCYLFSHCGTWRMRQAPHTWNLLYP